MIESVSRLAVVSAATLAFAQSPALAKWQAVHEIVAQTSTATVAGGGDPKWIPAAGQYSGTVGILMEYDGVGAFVCSGSLVSSRVVLTAAHCVSDGTSARPDRTTVFFYDFDPVQDAPVYALPTPAGVTPIEVGKIFVNPLYSGEVVDENDVALLRLSQDAPGFADVYELSSLKDLTGVEHTIAGYGARSISGGTNGTLPGFAAGVGRLRHADNRFDFRFGDADFEGYWEGAFGPQSIDHVWLADFDNGTAFRDNGCNMATFEFPNAPGIFGKPVFTTDKYCNLGVGEREGIGAGGDSGTGYFVDGKLAAVHSFALWYRADESANRFGQFKGSTPVYFHRAFINAAIPEPATWAMLILGFGLVGSQARRRRAAPAL